MYTFIDVSAATSNEVTARRTLPRKGIVLHETIGDDSLSWLQGGSARAGRPASADYLIDRLGNVYQITRAGYYAYHTGIARWQLQQEPDRSLNQTFVGIEFENNPELGERIQTAQYIAGAWLIRRLMSYFPIDVRNVVGHYQVALPSGRKSDPVTLNWVILTQELILPSVEANEFHVAGDLS